MSLTGQLTVGDLNRWCAANLTGTDRLVADVTAAVDATRPIRPIRMDDSSSHWATIGGALGQRLAFATQDASPYYALLGAHRAGPADWATVQHAAAAFPTHAQLDPDWATQLHPLPDSGWLNLDRVAAADLTGRLTTGTRPGLLLDLAERLAAFLTEHAPPGRLADTRAAEAVLARVCVVLTDLETAYRRGALTLAATNLWADPTATVPDLLDAVPDHQVDELVDLARPRPHRRHPRPARARRPDAERPHRDRRAGPHGALGRRRPPHPEPGDGSTLLDVKTITSARNVDTVSRWLWQLLAYAWLNIDDLYRIRTVGLYLARHGALVTWPLDHLAATMLDGRDVAAARTAFLEHAAHAWALEANYRPGLRPLRSTAAAALPVA